MKALFDSLVRTIVPLVVGAVISWFVTAGIALDPEFETTLTIALTAAFTGAYYVAVRLFETYVSPKFGWLLGLAKQPAYAVRPAETPRVDGAHNVGV
jgi:cation transporter-like permease